MTKWGNKHTVRKYMKQVWVRGDVAALDRIATDDAVFHEALPGETADRARLKQTVRTYRAALPDMSFDIEDQVADGDKVVTRWRIKGTHRGPFLGIPPTARPINVQGISITTLKDGKIREEWTEMDIFSALKQMGAVEDLTVPRAMLRPEEA